MRKHKKNFAILFVVVIIAVAMFSIRSYYYFRISSVKLPEGTKTIKMQTYVSDIYGYHVCAEKVVESELDYEEFIKCVREINTDDNIKIYLVYKEGSKYLVWLDDYSVSLVNSIAGIEKEGKSYYLITNNTPYGSFFY